MDRRSNTTPAAKAVKRAAAANRPAAPAARLRLILETLVAAVAAFAYLWTCRRVGARARALGRPLLRNGARIEIGEDVVLDSRPARIELAAEGNGRLIVGHGVRIGPGARLRAARYVEIGDRVRVGAGCVVSDETSRATADDAATIWIGDAVVLGDGVTVAPGTVIGAGAVVAPGCHVSGNVPPFALVGGVRAAPGVHHSAPPKGARPPFTPSPVGPSISA